MTFERPENEQRQEKTRLFEEALDQSERGLWPESAASNQALLEIDPLDVSALNRLGRSLTKLGRLREALDAYERAKSIEPANAIAIRNSARLQGVLETLGADTVAGADSSEVRAENFIMETGRSAVLMIEGLNNPEQIATILPGDMVDLKPEGPYLKMYTISGGEVGMVPAERAHRLLELIAAGNIYSAVVVNASTEGVRVLIRESYRSPETHGKLPFPTVSRQAPEARMVARDANLGVLTEEEIVREPDIDDDAEEPDENATEPLAETEEAEEPEE